MSGEAFCRILVIGAGGHAKVVIEAIRAAGSFDVVGVLDPAPPTALIAGVPVIGNDDDLPRLRSEGVLAAVVALGDNALRLKVGRRLQNLEFALPAIAHPSAFLAPSANIGSGAVVMARAVVGTDTRIEGLAIVNTAATIDHDGFIGLAAHIAPGCALAGNVVVGERSLVGVGSAVRPGIRIGTGVVVGAGSAVVADIPDEARVGGAPARALSGWGRA